MAAAAGILARSVTEILKILGTVVANEITLIWEFEGELQSLQSTVNMIMDVLEDAEKKQVTEAGVRRWMDELKAIAYDAADILDEYSYEIIRKHKQTGKVHKPSYYFCWRMAHTIKNINEKLNKIEKRKSDLGLQTIGSSSSSHTMMMMNRETYSLVVEDWKILGRENDKSTIIKMLLLEEEKNSNNDISVGSSHQGGGSGKHVSVISIVGMGGLGKTTMAQLVFNDETVKRHFDIRVWICVSDPFNVKKLFINIANSLDRNAKYDDAMSMENIVDGVKNYLTGKKFLLVLDDVWNENHADWRNLRTPLMVGAEGSKILVTTRIMRVAKIMEDKFRPYELGILKENDCWSLFKEIAFGSEFGAEETPNLVEIGKEMVKRCGGLPLALIFLGSLMRSKKKEEEWKIIRDIKFWHESRKGKILENEILPSLRPSYDYLPSHLKQCFSYCCIFPKDWIIKRDKLIRLWMAEGFFIESPGENTMSMEEIGNEYFHNLLRNFFFQDAVKDEDGDIERCKMHDLVHDLARSVVGNNECLIVENAHDLECISEATRRLSLVSVDEYMLPKVLEALKKAKNLRTVLVNNQTNRFDIGTAFKKNKRLRVLDLSESNNIQVSTSFIFELKHLRYLDVGEGVVFPKGICRLSFLQTLRYFSVGDKKKYHKNAACGGIEELEGLNLLTGVLIITHLENVTNEKDACKAKLKEKNLHKLYLSWNCSSGSKDDAANNHEAVLEGLQPHPNLRMLEIVGFHGSKQLPIPRWMGDSSCLPNLVMLTLRNCKCEQIAGFGALPCLRSLTLSTVDKLECIGNDFYYSTAGSSASASASSSSSTAVAFPSLKELYLTHLQSLKEWVVPPPSTTTTCFPLLERLIIHDSTGLTIITPTTTIFPSLKVLHLVVINGSIAKLLVTNNLNSLTTLTLVQIRNLISLPRQGLIENNNTLRYLEILGCLQFKGFLLRNNDDDDDDDDGGRGGGQHQQLQISQVSRSSLRILKLYDCPALKFIPDIRSMTSLQQLEIQDCKESKSLQDHLTSVPSSSSSSSSSSLEHLKYVKILKNQTAAAKEVVFEWRKQVFNKE